MTEPAGSGPSLLEVVGSCGLHVVEGDAGGPGLVHQGGEAEECFIRTGRCEAELELAEHVHLASFHLTTGGKKEYGRFA